MPYALEFPDSELRDMARDGALLRVRLSAAAARNEAGERGWLSAVTLTISAATLHGDATHAFGRIVEGTLDDGARLTVPGSLAGSIRLAMRLANGTHFIIRGDALEASLDDGAHFREDFSC